MLSSRGGVDKSQSARVEALRASVRQLDGLVCSLRQFSPRLNWSAQRCMIASTPFRMRLTGARRRLNALVANRVLGDHDGARWALEVNDACVEAERKLHDIEVCLQVLQHAESSLAERDRGIETFASNRSELLPLLSEIRHLITQQTIAEPGSS